MWPFDRIRWRRRTERAGAAPDPATCFPVVLEAFGTHPLAMKRCRVKLTSKRAIELENAFAFLSPTRPQQARILEILSSPAFRSLQPSYQWGGADAGGIRLEVGGRSVTVYGPQYWREGKVAPELAAQFSGDVAVFFAAWDALISGYGILFR